METITLNQTETKPRTGTIQNTSHKQGSEAVNSTALNNIFTLLKLTFVIVPVVAGIDKYTNLLTDWEKYLNPAFAGMLPFSPAVFMRIVGVIEIVAGILVFFRPAIGGLVVAAWLALIALTIIASGNYLDVAVRDLVMAISAFSMSRLSTISNHKIQQI